MCIDWLSVITQYGNTALILASGQCGTEAVVELVKAGADVNLQTNVCWCCVWILIVPVYTARVQLRIAQTSSKHGQLIIEQAFQKIELVA